MDLKTKEIFYAFQGKLVGNKQMRLSVCKTLLKMPREVVDFITEKCWFISSLEDAWAFTFTGNDLKDQHLIFLSDDLLLQDPSQIEHSIAHEIGHVILNHRNSTLTHQTRSEIEKQEREADVFVRDNLK